MEGDENIDNSYDLIGEGLYTGTYIGFNDSSGMNKYQELDLREIYFTIFPNLAALIFPYILGLIFLWLSVGFFVSDFILDDFDSDKREEDFCSIKIGFPFIYFFFCVGHLSYSVYEKFNMYGKLHELASIELILFWMVFYLKSKL